MYISVSYIKECVYNQIPYLPYPIYATFEEIPLNVPDYYNT